MRGYFREATWVLDDASFTYLGGRYRGRGLLTWQPDAGFHLEAFVTRSGPPIASPVHFWEERLSTMQDRTSIRMRIQQGVRALRGGRALAVATLRDRFDVMTEGRLSCNLSPVRFMMPLPEPARRAERWAGSALIEVGPSVLWPDGIVRTVELAGESSESVESSGLSYDTPTLRVRGQVDDGHLDLHWSMDKTAFQRADAWRWPTAFHDALEIELGRALPLLEREVFVSPSQHSERVKTRGVVVLDPFEPFEGDFVDKARLFSMTDFFLKGSREARVCRRLFDQMVRAKQQARWDDAELILSTALEGTLRALDAVPSSDRNWRLEASLARFRKNHLSVAWRHACAHAIDVFERLRHSTAHPDWILDKAAPHAEAARSTSFDGLRFLSRFYGYMILALTGAETQPIFGGRSLAAQPPEVPNGSGPGEVM